MLDDVFYNLGKEVKISKLGDHAYQVRLFMQVSKTFFLNGGNTR